MLFEQFVVRFALKGRCEIDLAILPGPFELAIGRVNGVDNQSFGEVHHGVVITIRLIALQHGELGIVLGANAFIAIHTTQLINPFHATHQQPLQVQLKGDPHEQLHIERVVMRNERPRCRSTGNGMERGAFNLNELITGKRVANRLHNLRAIHESLKHTLVVGHVQVPHALPHFEVGEAFVLLRRWLQGLGEKMKLLYENGEFARVGAPQVAIDANDIAQIKQTGEFPARFAELIHANEQLNPSGAVLNVNES